MSRILVVDDDKTTRLVLRRVLTSAGFSTAVAKDGLEALKAIDGETFDLMLLDVWMPRMNGLELLAKLRTAKNRPRVVVMTSDDAPETLLKAVREQAFKYVHKPVESAALIDTVQDALAAPETPPIEVVSARPEWLEIIVPCSLETGRRVREFVMQLDAKLPDDVRESIAQAFGELLTNAIEWGGRLDPTRKVRISWLRTRRMLLYRIADPGEGFDINHLAHAAISNPDDDPMAHDRVREEMGLRPGGLGLVMSRAVVDDIIYNEKRNEVVLVKYLD